MYLRIYFGLLLVLALPVSATELVNHFISPSFGGNPQNTAFLQTIIDGQNTIKDPSIPPPAAPKSALEQFKANLQGSVLSGLTRTTSQNLFDKNGNIIPNSTFTLDGFQVTVGSAQNGNVNINITDGITSTDLTVPVK